VKVLFKELRASSRAPRVSPRAPVQPRPAEPLTSAEQILALQRTIGNRATVRAIQRKRLVKQRPDPGVKQVSDPNSLPTFTPNWFTDKDRASPFAQGNSAVGAALSSDIGSPFGQAGKSDSFTNVSGRTWHGVDTYGVDSYGVTTFSETGEGLDVGGNFLAGVGDLLTVTGKGGELHGNRKDAKVAKHSGSRFWNKAARRQVKVKGADVGIAATKLVTSDMGKTAGYGVALGRTAGDIGGQAASISVMVSAAVALPIQVLAVLRDFRKLLKQGFRLHRMRKRLYGHDSSVNVQEALQLKNDCDQELLTAQQRVTTNDATIRQLEDTISRYEDIRDQLFSQALREGGLDHWDDIFARIQQADRHRDQARRQLVAVNRDLQRHQAEVRQAQADKQRADEAYKLMAAGVTDMAAEVKGLDQGEAPSLKALAYYARVKSTKGVARRTIKVIVGGLGVAAGIISIIALASGPGTLVLGPIGIALGSAGALLGLGLAAQTAWRFLDKRWKLTEGAYLDTGRKDEQDKPIYKKIEGLGARLKATLFWRTKLYNAPGQDEVAKERKSHRKLMAEALWDYATNDKYAEPVRQEAWAVIKDLTGRTRDEIVGAGSGNAPNGLTEKTVIAGQKAAALKLFEDKLKSA
jgi:hypothetical protein